MISFKWNYCGVCGCRLSPDDFDGICWDCDQEIYDSANACELSHNPLIDGEDPRPACSAVVATGVERCGSVEELSLGQSPVAKGE